MDGSAARDWTYPQLTRIRIRNRSRYKSAEYSVGIPVIERAIAPSVLDALGDSPVIVVNGARQVGKTTLVARLDYPRSNEVIMLDDAANRDAAGKIPAHSYPDR